jgi:hypothetical protein
MSPPFHPAPPRSSPDKSSAARGGGPMNPMRGGGGGGGGGGGALTLPAVTGPGMYSPIKRAATSTATATATATAKTPPSSSGRRALPRRLSTMNDSDVDDEDTRCSGVSGANKSLQLSDEDERDMPYSRAKDKLKKDLDIAVVVDRKSDNNVFLQENAVDDTFSWIRDMPRYLQDTGHIKPITLRAMSKSCRLGNFVVDEPLDLKEF